MAVADLPDRSYNFIYAWFAGATVVVVGCFVLGQPLRLSSPGSDIWQHLAAINAIAENPSAPTNPFVNSNQPSRLFGPLWVFFGGLSRIFQLTPVQVLGFAGIFNVVLWFVAIFVFGRAYFGNARGAVFLIGTVTLGWITPPSFTGYYSVLTLITCASYPATMALAVVVLLWGLCIRNLEAGVGRVQIPVYLAIATATHPLSLAVGIAGCGFFAILWPHAPRGQRAELICLLVVGAVASLLWPFFNVLSVLGSATSGQWTVGVDFYTPSWLFMSLCPAAIGLCGLKGRKAWPILATLALCAGGFILGGTPLFAAGHRLLPFIIFFGHLGLASIVSAHWNAHRTAIIAAVTVLAICQTIWTAEIVARIARSLERDGSLMTSAKALSGTMARNAVVAGYGAATFPLTAVGRRVLSTPFAEPLVPDMEDRQRASNQLFDTRLPLETRTEVGRKWGVNYLIADDRVAPPDTIAMLFGEHRQFSRHGHLLLFLM